MVQRSKDARGARRRSRVACHPDILARGRIVMVVALGPSTYVERMVRDAEHTARQRDPEAGIDWTRRGNAAMVRALGEPAAVRTGLEGALGRMRKRGQKLDWRWYGAHLPAPCRNCDGRGCGWCDASAARHA